VTLYFAYGSNMCRALMGGRCPGATVLGVATLAGWRFVITPDGVGSIAKRSGNLAYGVLWRLTARDIAAINAYESVDSGLYVRRKLAVEYAGQRKAALIYLATRPGTGRARPGYISLVVDAARDWGFPESYVRSLKQWSPSGWRGARLRDTGEVGTAMLHESNRMNATAQTICHLVIRGQVQTMKSSFLGLGIGLAGAIVLAIHQNRITASHQRGEMLDHFPSGIANNRFHPIRGEGQ